jgi:hypothetical protein
MEILEQHCDLEARRAMLGHTRIDATQTYAQIRPAQLKRTVVAPTGFEPMFQPRPRFRQQFRKALARAPSKNLTRLKHAGQRFAKHFSAGHWFKSGARNHLQANYRSVAFRFEIQV